MEHDVELIEAIAKARHEAYNTAPRSSNDHLEAALFVAMALALDKYYRDKNPPALAQGQAGLEDQNGRI